jgi:hypothetical protein
MKWKKALENKSFLERIESSKTKVKEKGVHIFIILPSMPALPPKVIYSLQR